MVLASFQEPEKRIGLLSMTTVIMTSPRVLTWLFFSLRHHSWRRSQGICYALQSPQTVLWFPGGNPHAYAEAGHSSSHHIKHDYR